jgi:hypothetical protein
VSSQSGGKQNKQERSSEEDWTKEGSVVNNSIREEENMKCTCGKGGECNCGGAKMKMPKKKMAYGGMAKKGYNKGGYCGASMPAERPMKKGK